MNGDARCQRTLNATIIRFVGIAFLVCIVSGVGLAALDRKTPPELWQLALLMVGGLVGVLRQDHAMADAPPPPGTTITETATVTTAPTEATSAPVLTTTTTATETPVTTTSEEQPNV